MDNASVITYVALCFGGIAFGGAIGTLMGYEGYGAVAGFLYGAWVSYLDYRDAKTSNRNKS